MICTMSKLPTVSQTHLSAGVVKQDGKNMSFSLSSRELKNYSPKTIYKVKHSTILLTGINLIKVLLDQAP